MSIPRMVIVAYRPKPGKDEVLLSEVRDHVHLLRSEGLATDRQATVMRAKDGTLVEIFEWASPAAIEEAHANPRVQAMWARFAACCDYVPLNSLPEAGGMFAEFETVHIQSPPIVQPDPDKRAE
jgi:quinol monooxygenase YgiN